MQSFIDDTARCVAFLSRIHVPSRYFIGHDGRLSKAVRAFPAAGLVIALPAATLLFCLSFLHVDALLAASLVVTVMVLMTGALHEDGLCDAADGLFGGRSREAALSIMKDSRIGTYGAAALVLSLLLRVAALAAILPTVSPASASLALLSSAGISRAAMVWHWSHLPPARLDGVAAGVGAPEPQAVRLALISGGVGALVLLLLGGLPWQGIALVAIAISLAVPALTRLVSRTIGGHTGDTIGAAQQVAEISVLAALALAV